MRLRRSDFAMWDVYQRRCWRALKTACHEARMTGSDCADSTLHILAWAMKRANARGLSVLIHRLPWLVVQMAAGIVAQDRRDGADFVRRYQAVHTPEERAMMAQLAEAR